MASARQACDAIDVALRLPPNTSRWRAGSIRGAGHLPANPGKPVDLSFNDIARIMLAVLVGSAVVEDYFHCPCTAGGARLGETVASFIDRPDNLFDLILDCNSPAATLTYRPANNGIETLSFEARERRPRPAFEKQVRIGPSVFIELSAAIKSAPEVRPGRRSSKDKYA